MDDRDKFDEIIEGWKQICESAPPIQPPSTRPPRRAAKLEFVRVPLAWVDRLAGARYAATLKLAHYILFRDWKSGGEAVSLSNKVLSDISRGQKWRGLCELEALGLIAIDRRQRKSPRVRPIWPKGWQAKT